MDDHSEDASCNLANDEHFHDPVTLCNPSSSYPKEMEATAEGSVASMVAKDDLGDSFVQLNAREDLDSPFVQLNAKEDLDSSFVKLDTRDESDGLFFSCSSKFLAEAVLLFAFREELTHLLFRCCSKSGATQLIWCKEL